MSRIRILRLALAVPGAAMLTIAIAGVTQAHVLKDFGRYSVALGWVVEPTYVGQVNAVQVVVKDRSGTPVTDIADGDLKVVVSIGGQQSAALTLVNKFDEDTGLGIRGDYEATITPTIPGDYTFHLTGKIHAQAVDETATSSDSTFHETRSDRRTADRQPVARGISRGSGTEPGCGPVGCARLGPDDRLASS